MFARISHKFRTTFQQQTVGKPTNVPITTYYEHSNQWYLPTIIGPGTLLPDITSAHAVQSALNVLEKLTADKYSEFVINFYKQGLERFGANWFYGDINTVLVGLAKVIQPESYMEIGVRRGRSMAMVASQAIGCNITGFDLWIENYAGMENPGPKFVREELRKVGFIGNSEFIAGDSRKTVPQYFKSHPDKYFDIITVDGDHSLKGARIDLLNVISHIKVGGILVFDDISNQSFCYLESLWNEIIRSNPQFVSYSFTEVGFGIGFAIRKY